ncbi:hypothetical protein [Streptomyces sp. NPDC054797]
MRDGARFAALPLLAAWTTGDVFWVSVVAAAGRAAWLLAPVIGTLVDRMPGRRPMVGANLARCVMMLVLFAVVATGRTSVTALVLLAFASGVAEVFFDCAAQAVVPVLAADHELERTNARVIAAQQPRFSDAGSLRPERVPAWLTTPCPSALTMGCEKHVGRDSG